MKRKWFSFKKLNEVFDIDGIDGAWIDTSKDEPCAEPWNKGKKTGQRTHNSQEVVWKGKKYKSQAAAAKANGVSTSTMCRWLNKQSVPKGRRGRDNSIPVTYKGRKYKSKAECMRKEKIGSKTLETYLNNSNTLLFCNGTA
jgi:hypothetical protein